jgi:hypothetical protein
MLQIVCSSPNTETEKQLVLVLVRLVLSSVYSYISLNRYNINISTFNHKKFNYSRCVVQEMRCTRALPATHPPE